MGGSSMSEDSTEGSRGWNNCGSPGVVIDITDDNEFSAFDSVSRDPEERQEPIAVDSQSSEEYQWNAGAGRPTAHILNSWPQNPASMRSSDQDTDLAGIVQFDLGRRSSGGLILPKKRLFSNIEDACQAGRTALRWVVVCISNDSDDFEVDSSQDVWNNKAVKKYIDGNFIPVRWTWKSPSAKIHRSKYDFNEFPYICVICPYTGCRMKYWEGSISTENFLSDLTTFLSEKLLTSEQIRSSRLKNNAQVENEKETHIHDSSSESDLTDDPHYKTFYQIKSCLNTIPTDKSQSTMIVFRFDDGSRKERVFNKHDKVRIIYEYVKAETNVPDKSYLELSSLTRPLIKFLDMTIEDAGLPRCSINVNRIF